MATYMNNIFNFGRDLPAPFDTLSNKKVGVSSRYGDKTTSTLCATMIKAIHAVINCMQATGEGAVGVIDQRTVAEYKSSASPDAYHLVVYDSDKGSIMASVYDKGTESFENYVLNTSGRDGAAVMMALFPVLMTDDEFEENFNAYRDHYTKGFTDFNGARDAMAILCDNAYRRIKDETCPAHVKVNVDKSGNLMRVSPAHIDSGRFEPKSVVAGEFVIMAKTARVTIGKATTLVEHEDFVGKYEFGKRSFNAVEQSLIPALPAWYIIPDEVVDICKHAQLQE